MPPMKRLGGPSSHHLVPVPPCSFAWILALDEVHAGGGSGGSAPDTVQPQPSPPTDDDTGSDRDNDVLTHAVRCLCTRLGESLKDAEEVTDWAVRLAHHVDRHRKAVFSAKEILHGAAACVFVACRQAYQSPTFKGFATRADVKHKRLGRAFTVLERYVHEKMKSVTLVKGGAEELVAEHVSALGLPLSLVSAMQKFVLASRRGVLDGHSPLTIVGAALYIVSHLYGHPRTLEVVGKAVGVSEATLLMACRLVKSKVVGWIDPVDLEAGVALMARMPVEVR